MVTHLGKWVLVTLPEHILESFNAGHQSHDPVEVGEVRPALVVGEQIDQKQEVQTGRRNPDGTPVTETVDLPNTVSLKIERDGNVPPYYVTGVPVDALHDVGSNPTTESDAKESSAEPSPTDSVPSEPTEPVKSTWTDPTPTQPEVSQEPTSGWK